jgi:lipopolysaccharide export system permease protein
MWLPNFIMGGIGIFFLVKNANEEPVILPVFFTSVAKAIQIKFFKIVRRNGISA